MSLAGLISAIAGWALIGRIGAISPTAGANGNLDSITAVVIGGTSLFGGRGSVVGTMIGALIVGVFRSAVSLAGLDVLWQEFAIGVLIIVAVALDQWIRRVSKRAIGTILTGRQLVKRYGRVTALDHADFDLYPNEILAVIGDNGAGESTLIKAICGAVIPDFGEIRLGGEVVHFTSPIAAREAGIERLPDTCAVAGAVDRRQHVPRPRAARAGHSSASGSGRPTAPGWRSSPREARRTRADDDPEHPPAGRDIVGWPTAGRRGGPRGSFRQAARHHGRADRGARREGIAPRSRAHPRRQEARTADHLISHNMPHVFEVADRIHIHRLGRRLTVVDPKKVTMSDAVAMMTGAMAPPAEAEAA